MDWSQLERQLISGARLVTIVAVAASLGGAFLMLYLGLSETYRAFATQFFGETTELPAAAAAVIHLIGALDYFLIAIVLMYFGYGIYLLFVRPDQTPRELGLPRWLHVERIGQLKQTVAEVIIVVLFVLFLRVSLETFATSKPEMSWISLLTFLLLPTAIFLLAAALKLVALHPKMERPPVQDGTTRHSDKSK